MTDSKAKIVGQAMLQMNGILAPLRLYGQDVYVDAALGLVKELIGQVIDRAQGKDVPIQVRMRRMK